MSLSDAWSVKVDQQAIEDAVTAERERCAKIAEEARCHEENCEHEACLRATRIAKQIRDSK